jgi:hypothetical protein
VPRLRLTDVEREQRRRDRIRHSFSDAAYEHYDPKTEGFGSAEEWIRMAEGLSGGHSGFRKPEVKRTVKINPDLVLLSLEEMPDTMSVLKTAYRTTMLRVHPDHALVGLIEGTAAYTVAKATANENTRNVLDAFKRLIRFY